MDRPKKWQTSLPVLPAAPFLPRTFPDLRARGLVGISDRALALHLAHYQRACEAFGAMAGPRSRAAWQAPLDAGLSAAAVQTVLASPVRALPLEIEGRLADAVDQVVAELRGRGIGWAPDFYLGEADFWTTDRATSINLPWTLANDQLWALVNDQSERWTPEDVVRIVRHEVGHALGYAFELWRRPEWGAAFGDFNAPYREVYAMDPDSTDHVRHLHGLSGTPQVHYAQKHADEDWAETFAVWLDPGSDWRTAYADWPGALAKLEAVDLMLVGKQAAAGEPPNQAPGRRVPFTDLTYTVAEYLGRDGGQSGTAAAVVASEGAVWDQVRLHEIYFEALARGAGAGTPDPALAEAATAAFGGLDRWEADLRALAAVSDGWVLSVWDDRDQRLRNVAVGAGDRGAPAGCPVIVALDLYEHAYFADYGDRKDVYVAAWRRNLAQAVVGERLRRANPPLLPQLVSAPPIDLVAVAADPESALTPVVLPGPPPAPEDPGP